MWNETTTYAYAADSSNSCGRWKNKVLQKIVSQKTQQKFPEFDSLNEDWFR